MASHASAGETTSEVSHRTRLYDSATHGNNVFVVGYPGTVLRSSDHGQTFAPLKVPSQDALFSIDINKAGIGAIVGRGGLVLLTTDGGATWTKTNALEATKEGEDKSHLFSVDVLETGAIVAVGDFATIVHSTDQGKTWTRRSFDAADPEDAAGGAANAGMPAASENMNEGFEDEARLTSVSFGDDKRGFVVGEFGMVIATTDGGVTWKRQHSATDKLLFSVHASSDKHAVAAGSEGTIAETIDGIHWTLVPTQTRNHLFGVWSWDGVSIAVGADGTIVRRASADAPFQTIPTHVHTWLSSIALHDAKHGVIAGGLGHTLRTENAGQSFSIATGE